MSFIYIKTQKLRKYQNPLIILSFILFVYTHKLNVIRIRYGCETGKMTNRLHSKGSPGKLYAKSARILFENGSNEARINNRIRERKSKRHTKTLCNITERGIIIKKRRAIQNESKKERKKDIQNDVRHHNQVSLFFGCIRWASVVCVCVLQYAWSELVRVNWKRRYTKIK